MQELYGLEDILDHLDHNVGSYFLDFLRTQNLEAGIIRLHKNEKDTQAPHIVDEIYYVIEGEGYIRINAKSYPVIKGTSIYVQAEAGHYFYGNKDEL